MSDDFHVALKRTAFEFLQTLKTSDVIILFELLGKLSEAEADFSDIRADGKTIYSRLFAEFVVDYFIDSVEKEIRIENIGFADDAHDIDDSI